MTDFEAEVLASLKLLKSQVEQILGIGQPGRLHELEHRLTRAERTLQRLRGAAAAFGIVLTLAHLAMSYFTLHHV